MSQPLNAHQEREALGRLSRVHGPAELHATLLALITPADSTPSFVAWTHECRDTPDAALLREQVMQLSDAARLPCLEALLARMRQCPKPLRRSLLESTRRLMASHVPVRPLDRLHWLLMRRKLGDRPPEADAPRAGNDFAELPAHTIGQLANVSAYLARMVPGPDAQAGLAWHAAVMARLGPAAAPVPCKAPDADGLAAALDEVEALPWMLRPVLVRAWVDAALLASGRARLLPAAADALRLAAGLLDSPMPPELARHFLTLDWPPVAAV